MSEELFDWVFLLFFFGVAVLIIYAGVLGVLWMHRKMPLPSNMKTASKLRMQGGPADGMTLIVHDQTSRLILRGGVCNPSNSYYQRDWANNVMVWTEPR